MLIPAETHLSEVGRRARENGAWVKALTEGLDDEALLWQPEPRRWGVAECLEHLVATGSAYHPRIREAIENGAPCEADPAYRPRLWARLFIHSAGPRGRLPLRAPRPFRPPEARPDVAERFMSQQDELLSFVDAARGVDLQRARVPSPVSRFLVLTLGEVFEVIVAHQERHLAQAQAVVERPGFPQR